MVSCPFLGPWVFVMDLDRPLEGKHTFMFQMDLDRICPSTKHGATKHFTRLQVTTKNCTSISVATIIPTAASENVAGLDIALHVWIDTAGGACYTYELTCMILKVSCLLQNESST